MSAHGQQVAIVVADTASALAIIGSFAGILPPLAAFMAMLWYAVQVWESDTVQSWLKGHRHVRRRKRLRAKAHHKRTLPP